MADTLKRVLRVVEFVGEPEAVDRAVGASIVNGTRYINGGLQITAGMFEEMTPEIEAVLRLARSQIIGRDIGEAPRSCHARG